MNCTTPTNRRKWWLTKLEGNAARDKRNQAALRKLGWRSVVVWECPGGKTNTPFLTVPVKLNGFLFARIRGKSKPRLGENVTGTECERATYDP
ncbi:MAG TPA: hypothetical protein VFR76_14390 [Verrucomicrobiae bacterium]|nr:hypothetical protein [Verrucomicrobiae bacterium]